MTLDPLGSMVLQNAQQKSMIADIETTADGFLGQAALRLFHGLNSVAPVGANQRHQNKQVLVPMGLVDIGPEDVLFRQRLFQAIDTGNGASLHLGPSLV